LITNQKSDARGGTGGVRARRDEDDYLHLQFVSAFDEFDLKSEKAKKFVNADQKSI